MSTYVHLMQWCVSFTTVCWTNWSKLTSTGKGTSHSNIYIFRLPKWSDITWNGANEVIIALLTKYIMTTEVTFGPQYKTSAQKQNGSSWSTVIWRAINIYSDYVHHYTEKWILLCSSTAQFTPVCTIRCVFENVWDY